MEITQRITSELIKSSDLDTGNYFKEKTVMQIKDIVINILKKIEEAYLTSKAFRHSTKSMEYSVCVSQVEKHIEILEIASTALKQKSEGTETLSFEEEKQLLEEMYNHTPYGKSVLLKSDIRLLQSLSALPEEKTYTNEYGSFYNLNSSLSELSNWFAPFVTQGAYKGVMCSFTNNYIISTINLNRMFTLIALDKREDQKQIEEKKYSPSFSFWDKAKKVTQNVCSFRPSWPENWILQSKHIVTTSIIQCGLLPLQVAKSVGSTLIHSIVTIPAIDYEVRQKEALLKLSEELPAMKEVWGFESFEILTTEELLKQGYPLNFALVGDCILLFHKRIQNNDRITELDD